MAHIPGIQRVFGPCLALEDERRQSLTQTMPGPRRTMQDYREERPKAGGTSRVGYEDSCGSKEADTSGWGFEIRVGVF